MPISKKQWFNIGNDPSKPGTQHAKQVPHLPEKGVCPNLGITDYLFVIC